MNYLTSFFSASTPTESTTTTTESTMTTTTTKNGDDATSAVAASTKPAKANKPDDSTLPDVTIDEVRKHNKRTDCWMIVKNRVYDLTTFIDDHPGYERLCASERASKRSLKNQTSARARSGDIILDGAGKDATDLFFDIGLFVCFVDDRPCVSLLTPAWFVSFCAGHGQYAQDLLATMCVGRLKR